MDMPPMPSLNPMPLKEKKFKKAKKNPGTFNELGMRTTSVVNIDFWDGFQFQGAVPIIPGKIMQQMASGTYNGPQPQPKLAITHTFLLGTSMLPSGRSYQFGANYMASQREVLVGRVDPGTGDLTMNVNQFLKDDLRMSIQGRLVSDSSEQESMLDGNLAYLGPGYTFESKIGYSGKGSGPTFGFSFLRLFGDNIKLGCNTRYVSKTGLSSISCGASISGAQDLASVKFTSPQNKPGKMVAGYYRSVDNKVSLATELEISAERKSNLKFGWQFNMHTAKVSGSIDSNLVTMATIEDRNETFGFTFLFASMLNHAAGKYKFGVGMNIGQ